MSKKIKNKYRVDSHRWWIWDYSAPSVYFITITTKNRLKLFGEIESKKMKLSDEGKIVNDHILLMNDYKNQFCIERCFDCFANAKRSA